MRSIADALFPEIAYFADGLWGIAWGFETLRTLRLTKPKRVWYNETMNKAIRKYLQSIGRKGGSVTSKAKAAASRRNGRLGGRPRKVKT